MAHSYRTATGTWARPVHVGQAGHDDLWVDPAEDLTVVFMTQLLPSGTGNCRGQLKTLVYPAIDSDPRAGLGQLDHPRAVILRGELRVRR
jgi:hypothetical protein